MQGAPVARTSHNTSLTSSCPGAYNSAPRQVWYQVLCSGMIQAHAVNPLIHLTINSPGDGVIMTLFSKYSGRFLIALFLCSNALFLDGCSCQDQEYPIWLFDEPEDPEASPQPDAIEDAEAPRDTQEEDDEDDWDWAFPDPEIEPDPPKWEETRWTAEVIEEGIPRFFADNDRTDVMVDRQGTVWLGYHRCETSQCLNPQLIVGHRRVGESDFIWEHIDSHSGLFGLEIIEADRPIVIYMDGAQGKLKAASREGSNRWLIEELPVQSVGSFDGFDVSRDRARYYVSHASQERRNIQFFTYNTASPAPYWRRLPPIENASSAAYERGLRAGNAMNFYLVHRDPFDDYILSEYDLGRDQWTRSSDSFPGPISSLLVRQNGEICTVGPSFGDLLVTCGSFEHPLSEQERIHGRSVYYLSSLIEARDQSLFVAYHDAADQALWVGRRPSGGTWTTESVYDGETFGASTAIDHRDHILLSFYHCTSSSCAVRLLERSPEVN